MKNKQKGNAVIVGTVMFLFIFSLWIIPQISSWEKRREERRVAAEIQAERNRQEARIQAEIKAQQIEQEKIEKEREDAKKEILMFIKEFSPDLSNKIIEIKTEIKNASLNISKLNKLAQKFPDQKNLVDESVKTWKEIQDALQITYADIETNLRSSYVTYKIDEIKGRKSFESIKSQLLEKANQSLASANHLRSTIQEVSAK